MSGPDRRPSRRTVVAGLTGAAALGGAALWGTRRRGLGDPARITQLARELGDLTEADVPRWLHDHLTSGASHLEVRAATLAAGALHGADRGDVHHQLVARPAMDLAAAGRPLPGLTLWAVLHATGWAAHAQGARPMPTPSSEGGGGWDAARDAGDPERAAAALLGSDAPRALLARAGVHGLDPHPTIYAADVADLLPHFDTDARAALLTSVAWRLADGERGDVARAIRVGAAALAEAPARRSTDPEPLARLLATAPVDGALDALVAEARGLSPTTAWAGLWRAAARACTGVGGALNGIHAVTATAAHHRMQRWAVTPEDTWHLVLTAAMRLVLDGPVPLGDPIPTDPNAARDRLARQAEHPGGDPHDLKLCEAALGAERWLDPDTATELVCRVAAHPKLDTLETWTVFDRAAAELSRLQP